jgi:hypothetical protein
MRWGWLVVLGLTACATPGAEAIPEANAEYELLVALGAYRPDLVAQLCPASSAGAGALTLRRSTGRVVRRAGPMQVEIEVQGSPAYPAGEGRARVAPEVRCEGAFEVRYTRQRGQWFLEEARLTRRETAP